MLSCDEATMICDKNQYGEVTFWEKLRLRIHLLACKICREYTRQNSLLTKAFHKKASQIKENHICMSTHDKEALKRKLEQMGS